MLIASVASIARISTIRFTGIAGLITTRFITIPFIILTDLPGLYPGIGVGAGVSTAGGIVHGVITHLITVGDTPGTEVDTGGVAIGTEVIGMMVITLEEYQLTEIITDTEDVQPPVQV
ncbi:hypothetical protein D1614_15620 [Maribellus luteus]|uniref:Uncharacterized protein n=1 Tax=Maribellus luteus TaxID=2305463 RepID=A0A399ST14_9BACT|nr:hypothetical protein D1614_15620 [Maribellus luteus]